MNVDPFCKAVNLLLDRLKKKAIKREKELRRIQERFRGLQREIRKSEGKP